MNVKSTICEIKKKTLGEINSRLYIREGKFSESEVQINNRNYLN